MYIVPFYLRGLGRNLSEEDVLKLLTWQRMGMVNLTHFFDVAGAGWGGELSARDFSRGSGLGTRDSQ